MRVSFLLHLYQPSFQTDSVLKKVAIECYIPLINLIKANKFFRLTLNIPLSLLESMDRLGYSAWIEDIRNLVDSEQVELTGTAAYHPLLTKISEESALDQIIFNEFGVGYYLGQHKGFDGEEVIMLKDVQGFFSPEMAINEKLLHILDDLGYKWVVGDVNHINNSIALTHSNDLFYRLPNSAVSLLIRDTALSNALAYSRDIDATLLLSKFTKNHLICLDGETFGHHNVNGINLLDTLVFYLKKNAFTLNTVSEYFKYCNKVNTNQVIDATWAKDSLLDIVKSDSYYLWLDKENKLQLKLYDLISYIDNIHTKSYFNLPKLIDAKPWFIDATKNTLVREEDLKETSKYVLTLKGMASDSLWNISNKDIGLGVKVYNKDIIRSYLGLVNQIQQINTNDLYYEQIEYLKIEITNLL